MTITGRIAFLFSFVLLGACGSATSAERSTIAAASSSSDAESAVRALEPGLTVLETIAADANGDGVEDALLRVDQGVDVNHCVIALHGADGWVASAALALGNDGADRCLGVSSGRVVVVQGAPGAEDEPYVTVLAVAYVDGHASVSQLARVGDLDGHLFSEAVLREGSVVAADGTVIASTVP